jgi:glycosyltransferase involved in cell wall biosynthesis
MNDFHPLISIVIPVYNRKEYIEECVISAINQTYKNIEIIIVDNFSTDGTWEICNFLRDNFETTIFCHQNTKNIGPVHNWKKGIELANGDLVKILFSDDKLDPSFLEETYLYLNNPEVGLVYTSVLNGLEVHNSKIIHDTYSKSSFYESIDFVRKYFIGKDVPFSPGCALFRKSDLLNNILLDIPSKIITDFNDHGAGPDLLIFLKISSLYNKIAFVKSALVFFRVHENSFTHSTKLEYLKKCYTQSKFYFLEFNFSAYYIKKYAFHLLYNDDNSISKLLFMKKTYSYLGSKIYFSSFSYYYFLCCYKLTRLFNKFNLK